MSPGLAFAAPALAAIATFFLLPVAGALVLSLTDFDLYARASRENLRFVGLGNYAALLRDPLFWTALGNTATFVAIGGPLTIALALGTALLVNSRLTRFPAFFRTVFFLPVVTTLVAVAIVWRYAYHPRYGLLNQAIGALGLEPIDWLGDPAWAMPAIILMAAWKNFGFHTLVFLAALQAIPERLYEAARLDGAGPLGELRHVTLPLLRPTFVFVAVITAIGYFQLFAEPYVMTQGGPADATRSLVFLMYEQGFRFWTLGTASALAFILFAIVLAITAIQARFR